MGTLSQAPPTEHLENQSEVTDSTELNWTEG